MPKRTDIKSILVIGAGPIVIGQACEFDYSGVQACKALKDEGYRVILINSNPATIMTDPGLVDATYVEPITPDMVLRGLELKRQGKPARIGPDRLPLFRFKEPLAVESAFGQPAEAIAVRPFADPERAP